MRRVFINFSVVFNLNIGTGFHPHGGGHHTVQHPKCFIALTAQHIRHQKGQIVNRNAFLQITKLDNFLQQLFFLLIIQINPQFLQVDFQTGLAGQLAQRIIAVTVKTVRSQPADIKVALFVTVGMNSRRLRKYVIAQHRHIGGNSFAAERLNQHADVFQLLFFHFCRQTGMVMNIGHNLSQVDIARTFAQTVHRHMHPFNPCFNRRQRVCRRQTVIIMGVELKFHTGITFNRLRHQFKRVKRIQHAQRIGQNNPPEPCGGIAVKHSPYIIRRIQDTV